MEDAKLIARQLEDIHEISIDDLACISHGRADVVSFDDPCGAAGLGGRLAEEGRCRRSGSAGRCDDDPLLLTSGLWERLCRVGL